MPVSWTYKLRTHGPCVYNMAVLIFTMTTTFNASGLDLVCPDIVYLGSSTHLVCSSELPSCVVTTNNVSILSVGDDLRLTVNITGHYCSKQVRFHLTAGNISKTIDSSSGGELVATFNISVTDVHFGNVGITYVCDGHSQQVVCDGVQTLAERFKTKAKIHGESTQITTSESSDVIYAAGVIFLVIVVLIAITLHSMRKEATRKHHPPTSPTVGWLAGGRGAEDSVCLIQSDHHGAGGVGAANSGYAVDEEAVSARGGCDSWMPLEEKDVLAERHFAADLSTQRGLRRDTKDDAIPRIMTSCMQDRHLRRTFMAIAQRIDPTNNQEGSYLSF